MCRKVFVGADCAMPILPYLREAPAFCTGNRGEEVTTVHQVMQKPFLYEVGASTGCGCGFNYEDEASAMEEYDDVPENVKASWRTDRDARVASVAGLANYVRLGLQVGPVVVFSCWYGKWESPTVGLRRVEPEYFGGTAFQFLDGEILLVEPGAG